MLIQSCTYHYANTMVRCHVRIRPIACYNYYVCICIGLELAKMSSMPADVLEEASAIASNLTRAKSAESSLSEDSPTTIKTHKIGRQLVQVARNSLLDADALRQACL